MKFRSQGGSDDIENLLTLCRKCHNDLHQGKIELKKHGKRKSIGLAAASQMNVLRNMLQREYSSAEVVYGYMTKAAREFMELEKSHINDAITIAAMGELGINTQGQEYKKRIVPVGDRILAKGVRGEKSIPKGKIAGFHRYDKVEYLGEEYFIKGRSQTSPFRLIDIYGNSHTFKDKSPYKYAQTKKLKRISARRSVLCTREAVIQSIV